MVWPVTQPTKGQFLLHKPIIFWPHVSLPVAAGAVAGPQKPALLAALGAGEAEAFDAEPSQRDRTGSVCFRGTSSGIWGFHFETHPRFVLFWRRNPPVLGFLRPPFKPDRPDEAVAKAEGATLRNTKVCLCLGGRKTKAESHLSANVKCLAPVKSRERLEQGTR